jgi:hypothetical protein
MATKSARLLAFFLLALLANLANARRPLCSARLTVAKRELPALSWLDGDNSTDPADLERRTLDDVNTICDKGTYVTTRVASSKVNLTPSRGNGDGMKPVLSPPALAS